MVHRGNFGTIFGAGLLAEVVVFVMVAQYLGFATAVFLTFVVSLIGTAMLRRAGFSALSTLKSVAGGAPRREIALVDGVLRAFGAVLLIVPGFLTDLIALFLLAPSGRRWVVRRFGVKTGVQASPRPRSGTIDLDSGEWSRVDAPRR